MSTEKLIQALHDVLEREREEAEARQRYKDGGGRDWAYHGIHFRQMSEGAGVDFHAALNDAIDARVRAVLDAETPTGTASTSGKYNAMTDPVLQGRRNICNEAESADAEIERLRRAMDALIDNIRRRFQSS